MSEKGRPICPVCLKPIQPGPSALREDNLSVHVACFDGVVPQGGLPEQPVCAYCNKPVYPSQSVVKGGSQLLHFDCWTGHAQRPPSPPPPE